MDRFHIRVATQGREHDRQLIAVIPQALSESGDKETWR
jgi:hypothetical protein